MSYAEINYVCQRCNQSKLARFGNKDLPELSLRFQIEIQGITCPACGSKIYNLSDKDYIVHS